jgi:hypothetical protein
MAVEQLAYRCWYATYDGGEDYSNNIHYKTEADAREAAGQIREDYDDEDDLTVEVGQYPAPCLTATCDGPGAEEFEDDEIGTLHFHDRAELLDYAPVMDWVISGDQAFCPEDAPAGVVCDVAPLVPVNMEPLPSLEGEGTDDRSR